MTIAINFNNFDCLISLKGESVLGSDRRAT